MRTLLSLLKEIRKVQLERMGAPDAKLSEVESMYRFVDGAMSGVVMNEYGGFDTPESKLQEAMTSADFTYALEEFIQRKMVPGYEQRGFDFEPLIKPDTTPNFLAVTRYQRRSGLDDLEYVPAKGEARPGSVPDATKRQYRVYPWQKQFDFDMQALVNDDLGYFEDTAQEMGRAARRTLEKFVSRMITNATSVARLTGLGANYSQNGRLTTARISECRMAFNQRTDSAGEPINARLKFILHHSGLVDTVAAIQRSEKVPELATNEANVVAGTFTPVEDPYMAGTAPNLPWFGLVDWRESNIVPLVLARRQGVPAPMLLRKKSDVEKITSLLGAGQATPPIMGDFATGNVVVKVMDVWGTYIDDTEGNWFDYRGAYYSSGTAP